MNPWFNRPPWRKSMPICYKFSTETWKPSRSPRNPFGRTEEPIVITNTSERAPGSGNRLLTDAGHPDDGGVVKTDRPARRSLAAIRGSPTTFDPIPPANAIPCRTEARLPITWRPRHAATCHRSTNDPFHMSAHAQVTCPNWRPFLLAVPLHVPLTRKRALRNA